MSASTQSPTLCVPQRMGHPGSSFYSRVNTASGIIDARYPKEKNTAKGCATRLGSSHVVTNSSGTILDDSDFYPYGGERSYSSSSGNTRKFTGKERDTESGLDDFAARFYTSNYGRFLSADESKYAKATDPQTWNLYTYVANNPINAVDPTGHDAMSGGYAPSLHMPTLEGGGGPTSEGGGGRGESEMDESFLGALSGNFGDDSGVFHTSTQQQGRSYIPPSLLQTLERMAEFSQALADVTEEEKNAIMTSVNESDAPAGKDKKGGNHEEGGFSAPYLGSDQLKMFFYASGAYATPDKESGDTVDPYSHKAGSKPTGPTGTHHVSWHVHPGGVGKHGAQFVQEPSPGDERTAGMRGGINIVVGARDRTVYFYNSGGVIGTIPLTDFMSGGH